MGDGETSGAGRITTEHIARWNEDGYVLVEDFLTAQELAAVQEDVQRYLPTWEEFERAPARYPYLRERQHFVEFPFVGEALNFVFLHPDLSAFASQVLGTDHLHVTMGHVWGKYAGTLDFEQPLHRDYHNNTLVVPRADGIYRQIPFMLYLSDVDEELSPTHVVAHRDVTGVGAEEAFFSREEHRHLYERERPLTARAGTLLIYDVTSVHRGSAMRASAGARWTYHFVYRAAGLEWMGWTAWPRIASGPNLHRVIKAATPEQRSLLGFPRPGDPYWNEDTIAGVGRRYPGMDMRPYQEAMVSADAAG